ncbi:MAG: hypothetical protein KC502_13270 [Myxococcales bacterium]|nr:hypothetical protein [Myxococcales bacterium]
MRHFTLKTGIAAVFSGLMLLPALSFAGPNCGHQGAKRHHVNRVVHVDYAVGQSYARPFWGHSTQLLTNGTCNRSRVRYGNGRLAAAGRCKRGLKRGLWRAYDRRGRIVAEAHFRRGRHHGQWIERDTYGQITMRSSYRRGRRYRHWGQHHGARRHLVRRGMQRHRVRRGMRNRAARVHVQPQARIRNVPAQPTTYARRAAPRRVVAQGHSPRSERRYRRSRTY